jgi:hypothetical protein
MSRTITPNVLAELAAGVVRPAIFVESQFPSGWLRLWSGLGNITWGGRTWTGAGTLLSIGAIEETTDVVATGTTVTLSGIPTDLVSLCINDARQGLPGQIYLGFLTQGGALPVGVIASPVMAFAGRLDVPTIMDGAERCEIQITYESRLIDLNRTREWRYTHESQQQISPGDLGFEYVAGLQEREIRWGMGQSLAGQASAGASAAVSRQMVRNFEETGSLFHRSKTDAQLREEQIEWNRNKDWSSDR